MRKADRRGAFDRLWCLSIGCKCISGCNCNCNCNCSWVEPERWVLNTERILCMQHSESISLYRVSQIHSKRTIFVSNTYYYIRIFEYTNRYMGIWVGVWVWAWVWVWWTCQKFTTSAFCIVVDCQLLACYGNYTLCILPTFTLWLINHWKKLNILLCIT